MHVTIYILKIKKEFILEGMALVCLIRLIPAVTSFLGIWTSKNIVFKKYHKKIIVNSQLNDISLSLLQKCNAPVGI